MESNFVPPKPLVIIITDGGFALPTYGFPVVAQIDTDIPVKHQDLAKYVNPEHTLLQVTVGENRAIYKVNGFDLSGNLICDLLGSLSIPTGLRTIHAQGDDPKEVERLLLDS